jgi:hypothetical protein
MGKHCPSKCKVVVSVYILLQQHVFSPSCTKIKIKCIEDFTKVPTCFGVLNTPSSEEQWSMFSVYSYRWCVQHTETCRDFCEVLYEFYFNLCTSRCKYMLLSQQLNTLNGRKWKHVPQRHVVINISCICNNAPLFHIICLGDIYRHKR